MNRPIRVLVIDDSAFMRKIISDLLANDPELEVVGTARDGEDGVAKILALEPDVVTLDIEMPKLDGFGVLRAIMPKRPQPVVMVSSLTQEGAEATVRALALGAVDFIGKPSGAISLDMALVGVELIRKVKAAATAKPRYRPATLQPRVSPGVAKAAGPVPLRPDHRLVVIGCSTGGPSALHQIIPLLPADLAAPVLVVQHMPPGFTASLARRLDELSALTVKEAAAGDQLAPGQVLVAPGGYHMLVDSRGRVSLDQGATRHGVRPAVDCTFDSLLPHFGPRLVGVILTGMGFDGAQGLLAVKRAGGTTIAEHQSSCVVYGMPKVAIEIGAADQVLPLDRIAAAISGACS